MPKDISSQRLWPLDHEAGLVYKICQKIFNIRFQTEQKCEQDQPVRSAPVYQERYFHRMIFAKYHWRAREKES